ncbi:DEAD/DEAH box helicase [Xenorhabdus sp. KJ12.1]|uniref:DEAD/DEAH box helicase family protein n=1 Tax=Xenorhabdus sp. KJ12.1 TaxID=1851571 RepID=UPI000C0474E0|nr:helicase [Xenorhabdus sp. KJ12.1]
MAHSPLPHNILRAWQRTEFFQPYTLEEKKTSIRITLQDLRLQGDNVLPWLSPDIRQQYEITNKKIAYSLHIGLFEKSISNTISEGIFGLPKEQYFEEIEQRLDKEGTTCFAKVNLNTEGSPILDKLSVSSLPWALGHLRKKRFDALNSVSFSESCEHLANTLSKFRISLKPIRENTTGILTANDILTLLLTHLVEWADFVPQWQYALQIDWIEVNSNDESEAQKISSENNHEIEDGLNIKDKTFVLPILNSFFFEDIEYAIAALKHGNECKALRTYLSRNKSKNPDLYTQEGLSCIIRQLHPTKMPHGRWPSEPEHPMSLMQQFAINTAIEELADGGLLSVNGPPGTGKTTLLRDLVAHNIVERAKKISYFQCVEDTLDNSGFIVNELTGFEMVVASSNNAAVENISKELPQKKSLAKEFLTLDYLAPTANQIATEKRPKREHKVGKNKKNHHLYRSLVNEKQCWGLVSAALGKKENRIEFAQRLLFDEHFPRDTKVEASPPENENFLSLWRWKNYHQPTSFDNAKKRFCDCLVQTEKLHQSLEKFAHLLEKLHNNPLGTLSQTLEQIIIQCEEQNNKLEQMKEKQHALEKQIQYAAQKQKVVESSAPGWFTRLVNRKKVHAYQEVLKDSQYEVLRLMGLQAEQALITVEQYEILNEIIGKKLNLQRNIEQITQEQENDQRTLQELRQQFPDIALPDVKLQINDAALQRTAFWQSSNINRQRSSLFVAAIELHQAWLYEALGIERFRKIIFNLKSFLAQPYRQMSLTLHWWQTLFMIVPVLSTTFASLGRMFHGVKSEELGWLMIDEAGQASPQQAVGGIWRAKRVLIVGDPLQIEPILTTSPPLVERLCQDILKDEAENWNPGRLSVQQVSDLANKWGCILEVMNKSAWIGIPLWVHRRCIEPMFSLANQMAYNNRMIHGMDADKICSQSINNVMNNHWQASIGNQSEKQYCDSHGNDLITLLEKLLSANISLNSIYIITPFKSVKFALCELLEKSNSILWRKYPSIKSKDVSNWKKNCIGTVHTFQGKENDIVIFVLGCDKDNKGGAQWAASKPNLLNVALTRAKKNIFVIGNPAVWHELPWFRDVARELPMIPPSHYH